MKGFKKNGKFRPTERKSKSPLSKNDCVSKKIPKLRHEGKPQKQSIAIAESICKRKKESIKPDMHECTRCTQQFDRNDPDYDKRVSRHIQGRHTRHETQNERFPKQTYEKNPNNPKQINGGLGGLDWGEAKFVSVKDKRKKETIDGKPVFKKYIAFNPASDLSDEWWTADSLEGLKNILWSAMAVDKFTIKKRGDGSYTIDDLEIYNTKIHPKSIEGLD